jgi:hypothetical protein
MALYRNIGRTEIYLEGSFIPPGAVFELPPFITPGENVEFVGPTPQVLSDPKNGQSPRGGPNGESESTGIIGSLAPAVPSSDAADLANWLLAFCLSQVTDRLARRVIQNRGPSWCRIGPRLDAALGELERAGRITRRTEGRLRLVALNAPDPASRARELSQLSQEEG